MVKVIEDRARIENQPEGLIFADRNRRNTILDFIDPEPYDHDDGATDDEYHEDDDTEIEDDHTLQSELYESESEEVSV